MKSRQQDKKRKQKSEIVCLMSIVNRPSLNQISKAILFQQLFFVVFNVSTILWFITLTWQRWLLFLYLSDEASMRINQNIRFSGGGFMNLNLPNAKLFIS